MQGVLSVAGWLQKDLEHSARQLIGVRNDGLAFPLAYKHYGTLWFTVSTRLLEGRELEVAVQGYTDKNMGRQVYYGKTAVDVRFMEKGNGLQVVVPISWDWSTRPEDPEGSVGWPNTQGTVLINLAIEWLEGL